MNVEITGRHIDITDPIKEYIEKRVGKFTKLVGSMCDFHFVLTVEKHRHIVEVNLNTRMGTFTATDESKDLYGAISSVLEKVEKQVRKLKDRRRGKSRAADMDQIKELLTSSTITDLGSPADLLANPDIIETEMAAKPMATEEAILELTESGGSFVVFTNAHTEQINVLYRRKDGHFGLIHP